MAFTPRGPMSENFWQPPTPLQGSAHDPLPQDLVAGHEDQRPDLGRPREATRALDVVIGGSTNRPKNHSVKGKLEDAVHSLRTRPKNLSLGLWGDENEGVGIGRETARRDGIERQWDEWEKDRETPYLPWGERHPDGSEDGFAAEAGQAEIIDANTTGMPREGKVADSGFWGTIRKALTQVIDDMTVPFPGSPPPPPILPTSPSSSQELAGPSLAQSFTQALDDMSFASPGEFVRDEFGDRGRISPLMLSEGVEGRRAGEEEDGFVLFECVERVWEGIAGEEQDYVQAAPLMGDSELQEVAMVDQQDDEHFDPLKDSLLSGPTAHHLVCIDHGTSWHADTQAVVGVGHGYDACMLHSAEARRVAEVLPEATLANSPTVRLWDPTAELSPGCRIGKVYTAVTEDVDRMLLPAFGERHDSATFEFDGHDSEWEDESASESDEEHREGSSSYRKLLGEFRTAPDADEAQNSCVIMSARAHAEPDPEILVSLPMPLNLLFQPFRTPSCHSEMRADPFPPPLPRNEMPPENFQLSDKPRAVPTFEQDVTTPPTSPLDMHADPPASFPPEDEMPRAQFQLNDKPQPGRGINQDVMEHLLEAYHATQQLGMPPGRGPTIAERMRYTFLTMSDEKRAIYISRMNSNGLWALYERLNEFEHEDAQAREDYKRWTREHTWGGQLQRVTSAEYLEAQRNQVFAEKARVGRLRSPPPYIDLSIANPDEQEEDEEDDDEENEQGDDEEVESPSLNHEQKHGDRNGVVITETELAEDDDGPVESANGGAGQVTSRYTHSPPHAGVDEAQRRIAELTKTMKTKSPSDPPVQHKTSPPPTNPHPSVDREEAKRNLAESFKSPGPSDWLGRPKSPVPTRSPIVPYKLKRTRSLSEDRSPDHQNYDQTGRFPNGFIGPLPWQPAIELGRPPTPEPLDRPSDKSPPTPARKVSGARNISPLPASPTPLRQVEIARYDEPTPQVVEMKGPKRVQRFDGFDLPPKRQAQEPSPVPDIPASLPPPYDEMMDDSGGTEHIELAGPIPSLSEHSGSSAPAHHDIAQSNALAEFVGFTGQTHSVAGPSRQRSTLQDDSVEQVIAGPSRQPSLLQDGSVERLMLDANVEVLDGVPFSEDPQDEMFGDAELMNTAHQGASTDDTAEVVRTEEAIENIVGVHNSFEDGGDPCRPRQSSDNTSSSEVPDLRSKPREMDTTLRATPEEEPVDEVSPEARLQRERDQSVSDPKPLAAPGSAQPQDASTTGDVHPDLQGGKTAANPATSQTAESQDTSTAEVADSRSGGDTTEASTSATDPPQDTTMSEDTTSQQQQNEEAGASTEPSPAMTAFRFPLKPDNAESATAGDGASILSRSTTGSQRSRHRRTGASDFSLNNGSWKSERTHSVASIGTNDTQAVAVRTSQESSTSRSGEGSLRDISNEQSAGAPLQSASSTAARPRPSRVVSIEKTVAQAEIIENTYEDRRSQRLFLPLPGAALKPPLQPADAESSNYPPEMIQDATATAHQIGQDIASNVQLGHNSGVWDSFKLVDENKEPAPIEEDPPEPPAKKDNMLTKAMKASEKGLERVSKDIRAARKRSKSRHAAPRPELKGVLLDEEGKEERKSSRRASLARSTTRNPFDDPHAVPGDSASDEPDGDMDDEGRSLLPSQTKERKDAKTLPDYPANWKRPSTPEEFWKQQSIRKKAIRKGKQRAVDSPDPKLKLTTIGPLTTVEDRQKYGLQKHSPDEVAKHKREADKELIDYVHEYGGDILDIPDYIYDRRMGKWAKVLYDAEVAARRRLERKEQDEELRIWVERHGGDIMEVPEEAVAELSSPVQTLFHNERIAMRLQLEEDEHAQTQERQVSVEDNEAYARRLQAEEDMRARQEEEEESMAEMQRQAAEPGEGMSALERVPTRRERASSSTQAAPAQSPEERRRTSDLQLAEDERIIENTPELRERRNWLDKGGDPQWPESDNTLVSTDETTDEDDDELSPTSESVSPPAQAPSESQTSQRSVGQDQGAASEPVRSHTQAQPSREAPTSGPNFSHAASPANTSLAEQLKRADLGDPAASSGKPHTSSQPEPGPSSFSMTEKPKRKAGYNFNFKSFGSNRHAQQANSTAASTSAPALPPPAAPSVPDERPSASAATDAPALERQSSVAQQQNNTAASSPGSASPPVAFEAAASTTAAIRGNDQTEAPPIPPRHPRRAQPNPEDQNGDANRSRRGSDGVDLELGEGDTTKMQRRHPELATAGGQRDGKSSVVLSPHHSVVSGQRSQFREDGLVRGPGGILGVQALEYEYGMLLLGIEDLEGLVTNTWMRRLTGVVLPKARWDEEELMWILFSVEQLERLVRSAVALRKENAGKGAMTSHDIDEGFRIESIDHLKDLVMMIEMDADITKIKTAVLLKQSGRRIIHKLKGDKTTYGENTDTSPAVGEAPLIEATSAAVSEARLTEATTLPPPTPKLAPSRLFTGLGGENIASTFATSSTPRLAPLQLFTGLGGGDNIASRSAAPPTPRLSPSQLLASFGGVDDASGPHTTTSQVPPPTPRLKDNLEYFDNLPPPRSRHRGELFGTSPLQTTPAASSCAIIDDDDDFFTLTEEERTLLENAKNPEEEEAAWSFIKTRVQAKAKKVKAKRMADKKEKERRWGTAQDVIRSEDPTMIKAEAMRARRLSDERIAGLEKQNVARREKLVAAEKVTPKKKAVKKEEGNFDVMADREDIANWAFTRGTGWTFEASYPEPGTHWKGYEVELQEMLAAARLRDAHRIERMEVEIESENAVYQLSPSGIPMRLTFLEQK
ncbi:hypothetical protein LTR56_020671 [Elasticomyces elasticus]|nr:hypothetical protein LTR56_020671 [Elasticomyces elasticus]KAK3653112.1 hypothetical protein LTR22_011350 [Elasticomyces elasticus]KAK4919646.1 hypothetical protein LTR49_012710 [Elasticomyces elasticus]KAK5751233.1 hypothetical protein LTS12_018707 [Elasticomyces elasticus]